MLVLVGIVCAWMVSYASLGLYFGALARRERGSNTFKLFAASCVANCGYAGLTAAQLSLTSPARVPLIATVRVLFVLATTTIYALLVESLSRRDEQPPWWVSKLPMLSMGVGAVVGAGYFLDPVQPNLVTMQWTPMGVAQTWNAAPNVALTVGATWGLFLTIATTIRVLLVARRGEQILRAVLLGTIAVCVAAVWDATMWLIGLRLPTLLEHVSFLFSLAVSYTLTAHIADEARRRRDELQRLNETVHTLRETLQHKEQLAAVGELSAVLAHEVRNPISVICNAVANLRRPELPASDRSLLHSILDEESHRLNRIVTNMLQLARPLSPEWRRVDPRNLLRRVIESAEDSDVDVRLEIADSVGDTILADGDLLRQAVQNVVDNAMQAMRGGGTLTVVLSHCKRDAMDGLEFRIADTGEGMNTEVRSRARDAFFTTRASGTGLGLAIVDRIVRAMDGVLTIESARDQGTTVRIWIPHRLDKRDEMRLAPRALAVGARS